MTDQHSHRRHNYHSFQPKSNKRPTQAKAAAAAASAEKMASSSICPLLHLPILIFLIFTLLLTLFPCLVLPLPVDTGGGGVDVDDRSSDEVFDDSLSKTILLLTATSNHPNVSEAFEEIVSGLPETAELVRRNLITHSILLVAYGLLIVVSLVGNSLVCRVLLGAKLRSGAYPSTLNLSTGTGTSKLLIVNLAASDLLLTTVNIPTNLVRFVARDWTLGEFICSLMPYAQSVSAYCSAWTMMVIAFERYRK